MRLAARGALLLFSTLVVLGCKRSSTADQVPPPPVGASLDAAHSGATDADARFWRWFETHASRLLANADFEAVMLEIGSELEKTHPGLIAELTADDKSRILVLSADGDKMLFPTVQRLFAARPTVPGWSVVAFRQPARPGDPLMPMEMNGKSLDPAQIRFVVVSAGDTIDLDVYVPDYVKGDETIGLLGFLALDHVVGEYVMETRIGGIGWYAVEDAPATARPLAELPSVVAAEK